MPVYKAGKKYKVGKTGKAMYRSRSSANRAYKGYLGNKRKKK